MKTILAGVLFFFFLCPVHSQSLLRDPQIADGEKLNYRIQEGEKITLSETWVSRTQEADNAYYLIATKSPELTSELKVLSRDMSPLWVKSQQILSGAGFSSQTVLTQPPVLGNSEILVLKTADLGILLRGYPFEKPATLGVFIVGSPRDSGFHLEVQFRGVEDLRVQGRIQKAYKLELVSQLSGALALFGGLIPKIYFWYAATGAHPLLRYEGTSGFGSNKPQVTELQ